MPLPGALSILMDAPISFALSLIMVNPKFVEVIFLSLNPHPVSVISMYNFSGSTSRTRLALVAEECFIILFNAS